MANKGLALAALGAGAIGLVMAGRKDADAAPASTAQLPQPKVVVSPANISATTESTSTAPKNPVTGKSGARWLTQVVKKANGQTFVDVFTTVGMRVVRYKQTGSDRNTRTFVASPKGVASKTLKAAVKDFGIKQADAVKAAPAMSLPLKEEFALSLKNLGVDPDTGKLNGQCSKLAIQGATATAGKLERAGFKSSSDTLRNYISECSSQVPPPPPAKRVPLPTAIPQDLQERINKAIELERDPKKLKVILNAIQKLPPSRERDDAVNLLRNMIAQLAAREATAETLQKVDEVINQPAPPPPPSPQREPVPQAPAVVMSPVQVSAIEIASYLKGIQDRNGIMSAKRNYDVNRVKAFQTAAGITADGLPGPTAMTAMALHGAEDLPLVMFWPKSATSQRVLNYRASILTLAGRAQDAGDISRAEALETSARRERGQAGIVGPMPA